MGEHRVVDYLTKLEHTIKKKIQVRRQRDKSCCSISDKTDINDMIIYFNVSPFIFLRCSSYSYYLHYIFVCLFIYGNLCTQPIFWF